MLPIFYYRRYINAELFREPSDNDLRAVLNGIGYKLGGNWVGEPFIRMLVCENKNLPSEK